MLRIHCINVPLKILIVQYPGEHNLSPMLQHFSCHFGISAIAYMHEGVDTVSGTVHVRGKYYVYMYAFKHGYGTLRGTFFG